MTDVIEGDLDNPDDTERLFGVVERSGNRTLTMALDETLTGLRFRSRGDTVYVSELGIMLALEYLTRRGVDPASRLRPTVESN